RAGADGGPGQGGQAEGEDAAHGGLRYLAETVAEPVPWMDMTSTTAHGEYKVPGGKLVVADLELSGGRVAAVQVSGDFFLEPAEARDAIDAAIVGMQADAGE